jgi:hypothetical protein
MDYVVFIFMLARALEGAVLLDFLPLEHNISILNDMSRLASAVGKEAHPNVRRLLATSFLPKSSPTSTAVERKGVVLQPPAAARHQSKGAE